MNLMVTNSEGEEINYFPLDMSANEESDVFVITVNTSLGGILKSTADSDILFLGRRTGTTDNFSDLAGGLDLEPYVEDLSVQFDVKAQVGTLLQPQRIVNAWVGVSLSGQAGWSV